MIFTFDVDLYNKLADFSIYTDHTIDFSTGIIMSLCSVIGLFTFNTYLNIALFFSLISFLSAWYLYIQLIKLYPNLTNQIFYILFFTPTIIIWGSGIFRDTLSLAFLSIAFGLVLKMFINNSNRKFSDYLKLFFCLLIVTKIKIYITIAFIPFLFIYILRNQVSKLNSKFIGFFIFTFISIFTGILLYLLKDSISESMQLYAFDNLKDRIFLTYNWISTTSENGARYDLGDIDFTSWKGILSKIPAGINVTLFRPYPWEASKAIIMFSALESFFILLFTIYTFLKVGIFKCIKNIFSSNLEFFLCFFCLTFAFLIGISTGNFGSLVRYKLPLLPFWLLLLFILNMKNKKPNGAHQI